MCQNRQHKKWNGTHGYGALAYIGNHYHQYNKRRRLKSSFIVFNKVRPSVPWHKRISSTNRYHRRVRVQIHCVAVFEQWLIEILLRRFFFLLRLIICVCVCLYQFIGSIQCVSHHTVDVYYANWIDYSEYVCTFSAAHSSSLNFSFSPFLSMFPFSRLFLFVWWFSRLN